MIPFNAAPDEPFLWLAVGILFGAGFVCGAGLILLVEVACG